MVCVINMGRRKKEKKFYFGDEQEKAVIEYINTNCKERKNEIYEEFLKEPFRIMTEAISKKYPIHLGNYTLEEIQQYALSHLIENMIIYNPNRVLKSGKKPKAFSYCQTIVRNYYKLHSKVSRKEILTNLSYELYHDEVEKKDDYMYELYENNDDKYIKLLDVIINKIQDVIDENKNLKNEEIIVGEGIINILRHWDILFMEEIADSKYYNDSVSKKFAKNKILFLLKEQTRLSTKEIRLAMKPYTDIYYIEKTLLFNE